MYIEEFVRLKGILSIMKLIDICCSDKHDVDYNMIYSSGQILATVFKDLCGIKFI